MRGLEGMRAVVAGGASGIGAATAERLSDEGALVVVGDIDRGGADGVAAEIDDGGGSAFAFGFDLADSSSSERLVARAVQVLGGIDALVNVGADLSPGTVGADTDLLASPDGVWERTIQVNLLGYVRTCRAAIPHMLAAGTGSIVNVSSGAAFIGEPTRPAYAASKVGVEALTRHVARRWGPEGIRCNTVSPGMVDTPALAASLEPDQRDRMARTIALRRLGRPADVASTITYLLSEDASWITGQVWNVDGGQNFRG